MPPLGKSTVNISVYTPKGPPVLPWPSGQRHNVHVRIVTRIVYTAARGVERTGFVGQLFLLQKCATGKAPEKSPDGTPGSLGGIGPRPKG